MEPESVRTLANRCFALFDDCLAHHVDGDSRILATLEKEQRRLRVWSNSLKVFSRPHVSLDAQLSRSPDKEIGEMVLLLLDVLRENLDLVGAPDAKDLAEFDLPFFGIDGCLKRLEKLAAAILDATEESLHRRVRKFAEKNKDEVFERLAWLTILTRFGSVVSESDRQFMWLQLRGETDLIDEDDVLLRFSVLKHSSVFSGIFRALFETTIFRQYRMAYEREGRLKDSKTAQPVQPSPIGETTGPGPQLAVPENAQSRKESIVAPLTTNQAPFPSHDDSQSQPTVPNTIDGLRFKPTMEAVDAAGNESYAISESGDAIYPRPPRLPEGANEGICHLCGQYCTADTFQGHEWIIHLAHDIKPYVCISEDCAKSPPYFVRRWQWKQHMEKIHTTQWLRSLLTPFAWKCSTCSPTSPEIPSQGEWVSHMEKKHGGLGEEARRCLESGSRIPKLRPTDICPICLEQFKPEKSLGRMAPENESDVKNEDETQHSPPNRQKRVGFSIPESVDGESDADSGAEDGQFQMKQRPEHAWAANHIAQHMKSLAFFFSTRFVQDVDQESNAPVMSRGNSTQALDFDSLSALDFSVSESDFPRLPEPTLPAEGGSSADEISSDMACIAENLTNLLADWGGDVRPLEPNLPPEDLELLFPRPNEDSSNEPDLTPVHNFGAKKVTRSWTSRSRPYQLNDVPEGKIRERLFDVLAANKSAMTSADFIPWGALEEIITKSSVVDELSRWWWTAKQFPDRIIKWFIPARGGKTVEEQAEIICNGYPHTPGATYDDDGSARSTLPVVVDNDGGRCLRKIFAILLLIDRPFTIKNFIDEGLFKRFKSSNEGENRALFYHEVRMLKRPDAPSDVRTHYVR
ncbi:hypothetical protein OQA88_7245 [Cercophora sp. LCS_1]